MAIPATPTGFSVQQGNGQVLISWDLVAGATFYNVERSTDGVTFLNIIITPESSYLDTSVVTLGVLYYYRTRSLNGSGFSQYTVPQKVVPAYSGKLSLLEIRQMAKVRADMQGSPFVPDPEWNQYINQSYFELYDLLVTVYEDYYLAPPLSFNTNGTDQFYDLPNGLNYNKAKPFYKLVGVDLGLNTSTNAFVTLNKFNFIDRNRYLYPNSASTIYGVFNMRYRLMGSQIEFTPIPSSNQPVRLWYIPRLLTLLKDTDLADGIDGWLEYVIVRAAKFALDKEESDSSKLDAELLFLKNRIEESAINRDAGRPDTISDVRQGIIGGDWGSGSGWNGPIGGF